MGSLVLSKELRVRSADEVTAQLCGLTDPPSTLVRKRIDELLVPVTEKDTEALQGEAPLTYLAAAPAISTQLLVHIIPLPGSRASELVATVTSVNEYLAESQALARVQLRNTVESIIAGFAHEVRNPMASILCLTEAALQLDPSPDSVLVRIPSLVARVESLIKQALTYSRPTLPKRSLHHTAALLEHAVALLRVRDGSVQLDVPRYDDVPPVMVDLSQGEQVVVNLLENALDAAKSRVQLQIRAGKTSVPSVCIEVSDDGPGVPPDIASRIFDPFFTTKAHGTGLGLAIARDLARLNGGDLRYVQTAAGGATFQLYLPSTAAAVRGHW